MCQRFNERWFMFLPRRRASIWRVSRPGRQFVRLAVVPTLVGAFAGVEVSRLGLTVAVIAAYGTFLIAEGAVRGWDVWQFRRARQRLAAARARTPRRERRDR
jgi:hypothetical protein